MVWVYIGVVLVMRIFQCLLNKYNAKLVPKTATAYLKYTLFYLGVAGVCAAILFLLDLPAGERLLFFRKQRSMRCSPVLVLPLLAAVLYMR